MKRVIQTINMKLNEEEAFTVEKERLLNAKRESNQAMFSSFESGDVGQQLEPENHKEEEMDMKKNDTPNPSACPMLAKPTFTRKKAQKKK